MNQSQLHPLRLIEATAIKSVQMEGVQLSSPVCQKCLHDFQENMRLSVGLGALAGYSSMITGQWAEAGTLAANEVFGEGHSDKVLEGTAGENREFINSTQRHMARIVSERSPLLHSNLEFSTKMLEQLVMNCGPFVHGMFEGTLKSICIQSWTSFEVLFEDLLIGVVEESPAQFPSLNKEQFYFRKLDGCRKWYFRAFRDERIRSVLENPSLDALAQLRHLLVHRGGLVDEFFLRAASTNPSLASLSGHKSGDSINFDGDMLRSFLDPALAIAYQLIELVDRWCGTETKI